MPDKTRHTVSASQVAGLFNVSPFCTRWMLYQHFKNGTPIDSEGDERTGWGLRLEDDILDATAEALKLEITTNADQRYYWHPQYQVGCTRDAHVIDPALGFGIVEAKNVDRSIFYESWTDDVAPKHIELQIQTQMMVPDPVHGLPKWGVIAALVGGNDFRLYHRTPDERVQAAIRAEAALFMTEVREGREPDPFGTERELDIITKLYQTQPETFLDVRGLPGAHEVAEQIRDLSYASQDRLTADNVYKALKAKLLGLAREAETVLAPGWRLKISRGASCRVTVRQVEGEDGPAEFDAMNDFYEESLNG